MYNGKMLLAMLLLLGLVLAPTYGFAANKTNSATAAIAAPAPAGTLSTGQAFPGGSFIGTVTLTGFQVINGVLNAVATLTGHLVDTAGNPIGSTITQTINLPVAVNGSCPILNLTLGPLDLNLLGLQIHLNQVVLNIVAESGAGNLLGNLLCAVANLLNAGGPLQTLLNNLAILLNQILAAL
jgi:hypothetical protein